MTLQRLAYFALLAKASPRDAAREFLLEAPEAAVLQVLEASTWTERDVQRFEAEEKTILVSGRWGQFWLASPRYRRALVPPAPRVTPSGIKALAEGLLDELLTADVPSMQGAA